MARMTLAQLLNGVTRFGRLTVVGDGPDHIWNGQAARRVYCRCDCGGEALTSLSQLRLGRTQSCGCLSHERASQANFKHGKSSRRGRATDRLNTIWVRMRSRCNSEADPAYPRYGGRGIRICEEWASFAAFERWALSNGYHPDLSIDRIDNDGGYNPSNCRWATRQTQNRNTSRNRLFTYRGRTACLPELVEGTGLCPSTVRSRIHRGWSVADAMERPLRPVTQKKRINQT